MSNKIEMSNIPTNSIIEIQHRYDDYMEKYIVIKKERGFLVLINEKDSSKRYTRLSSIKKIKINDQIFVQ